MVLVIDILYTTSTTWYTISRYVMLFYVPALVYVVVSAYGSRHDCEVCAVRLFNISAALR